MRTRTLASLALAGFAGGFVLGCTAFAEPPADFSRLAPDLAVEATMPDSGPFAALGQGLYVGEVVVGDSVDGEVAVAECIKLDVIKRSLAARQGERPHWSGMAHHGAIFDLFVSEDGGSWTLVQVEARGCARIVAAGTAWWRAVAIAERRA